jgi:hypothetical protein
MRQKFAVSLALLLASAASSAPAPEDSWGKAGVSFEQYRQDAVDCAAAGYFLDISNSADAQQFVTASRKLNNLPGPTIYQTVGTGPGSTSSVDVAANFANIQQHIIESVRPEERFKNIKRMQLAKTNECLVNRGYSKFRLTDNQRDRLRHLKFGSDKRREYLYSLATNPSVLATQKAPPPS